jgi:hypothetical protein
MARVVEQAGLGAVAVVHVGSDGGFDLPDALHPDVLPLALAHDLPIIGTMPTPHTHRTAPHTPHRGGGPQW